MAHSRHYFYYITLCLILTCANLQAVEQWQFTLGSVHPARYIWKQTTSWASVGDAINYETVLDGHYTIAVSEGDDLQHQRVTITLTSLRGSHRGGGKNFTIDSDKTGKDLHADPVLGPSLAALNIPIELIYDSHSKTFTQASGSEKIIKLINDAFPPPSPGLRHPLAAQAEARFGNAAQLQQWNTVFCQPGSKADSEPINGGIKGDWRYVWEPNQSQYRIELTSNAAIALAMGNSQIDLSIVQLEGSGQLQASAGQLVAHEQKTSYQVSGIAHTQRVTQNHTSHWGFSYLATSTDDE